MKIWTGKDPLIQQVREIKAHVLITGTSVGRADLSREILFDIILLREFDAIGEIQERTSSEVRVERAGGKGDLFVFLIPGISIPKTLPERNMHVEDTSPSMLCSRSTEINQKRIVAEYLLLNVPHTKTGTMPSNRAHRLPQKQLGVENNI